MKENVLSLPQAITSKAVDPVAMSKRLLVGWRDGMSSLFRAQGTWRRTTEGYSGVWQARALPEGPLSTGVANGLDCGQP